MIPLRPYCLTIAGFDPSGGAGILADIKTFEANKVHGMGIVTGLTFQNDTEFDSVHWIVTEEIIKQTEVLLRKFKFEFVKIGMIKDVESLKEVISFLHSKLSPLKIIWDPIIMTSSGYTIQENISSGAVRELCKQLFLITPNIDEIKILMNDNEDMNAAKELSRYCNVFLKGGHRNNTGEKSEKSKSLGKDYLFTVDGKLYPFRAKKISAFSKHGSGCVISSAITASLAKGDTLLRSCLKGKNFVTDFLFSNKTLLGYHKI